MADAKVFDRLDKPGIAQLTRVVSGFFLTTMLASIAKNAHCNDLHQEVVQIRSAGTGLPGGPTNCLTSRGLFKPPHQLLGCRFAFGDTQLFVRAC